VKSSNV